MKSISLYRDEDSFLNRLNPLTKLFYVLAAVMIPFISGEMILFPVLILLNLFLLFLGKVLGKAVPLTFFSFTLIAVIFLIQGMFNKQNESLMFSVFGLKFYREGLLYALRISFNILNILFSFAVFLLTTSPNELVDELERKGLSPRIGYIVNSVFQILPEMMGTMDTITDAQRSRGMETEGSLFVRIKAFLPLVSPVVMSSLVNTRERAIALEVRGFGRKNKKSFLKESKYSVKDRLIIILIIIFMILSLLWRILV